MRGVKLLIVAGLCAACAGTPDPQPPPPAITPVVVAVPAPARAVDKVVPLRRDEGAALRGEPPESASVVLESTTGEATYYADRFDGRRTASGVVFSNDEPYAAHRTYPFGTVLRVTNTRNNRSVIVRVVDRGPHGASARARRTIIDVSRSAAHQLDFVRAGRAPVRVDVLEWGIGR